VAVADLIRNVLSGSDTTSTSNITLAALACLFSICQWVLKDKTLFSDSCVSLRRSWRRDTTIEPHPEESNSSENGDSESQLGSVLKHCAGIGSAHTDRHQDRTYGWGLHEWAGST
jgi:hypothetical protein